MDSFFELTSDHTPVYPPRIFLQLHEEVLPPYPDLDVSSYDGLSEEFPPSPTYEQ